MMALMYSLKMSFAVQTCCYEQEPVLIPDLHLPVYIARFCLVLVFLPALRQLPDFSDYVQQIVYLRTRSIGECLFNYLVICCFDKAVYQTGYYEFVT